MAKASAFSKVELDHTHDIRAWREYLGKQLRLQQESSKARDYGGVKLFAQKILSVLPDDFCAMYYVALAERYSDNDTAFTDFLLNADLSGATPDEKREVVNSLVATAEPRYIDSIKAFIARAYPDEASTFEEALDRSVKNYIQKLKLASDNARDVFICHRTAAPDQDIADAICTRLEERGLRCWIAPRNILAGSQNYERDIIKGVENCRLFLFVSSFKSIYSEDCETELRAAVLADKVLYSYRIDDTPYDGAFRRALSQVQWLDAADAPYAHLEQLVIDIKGMLAEDEREKAALEEKRLAAREKERRLLEEQRAREQERLERLEKIVSGETAVPQPTFNYRPRLKRAEIEVNSGHYERAEEIIDDVLDCDPENSLAWWLLLLCDYRVSSDKALTALNKDFTTNANYRNAERFADSVMQSRIDAATSDYKFRVIKSVNETLDRASAYYEIEDFKALSKTLDECAAEFNDEDGIVFSRFPDVASRYYWLRLWAKYGQTPLVCVEDITREREYKTAVRYASPAQAAEYEKARSTISKNARLFLRERSKNRANDGKLVDYLIDNKNILPIDTYNHYSSLLYFRKMLDQLNMTEAQLRTTTIDISTNEYFMLAQSIATAEQKKAYDELAATLDGNRERKNKSRAEERERKENEHRREQQKTAAIGAVRTLFIAMFSIIAYGLFIGAVAVFVVQLGEMLHHLGFRIDDADDAVVSAGLLLAASIMRIITDSCMFSIKRGGRRPIALSYINLAMGVISIPILAVLCSDIEILAPAVVGLAFTFVSLVMSGATLSKHRNNNQQKEE